MPRFEVFAPTRANLRTLNARAAAEKLKERTLPPTIDSQYFASLTPARYKAALDFISSLTDFQEHEIETASQFYFDVRALMFFAFPGVRWVLSGTGAQVYSERIHPGNEKLFLDTLAGLV